MRPSPRRPHAVAVPMPRTKHPSRAVLAAILMALGLALTMWVVMARADSLAIGSTAPMTDVRMKGVDDREVTLAGVKKAKGTLVVFTCNHCPWARAWEARLAELGNTYAKRGIGVVWVNPNDPEAYPEDGMDVMKEHAAQRKLAFPYVVDATSDLARAFGATKTPEAYLFDASGKLVYHGAPDDNAKEPQKVEKRWLRDALEAVAGGKGVEVAETKALGCSIKLRTRASS